MNIAGIELLLVAVYFLVLGALCTFGAHRAVLVYQCLRHRRRIQRASRVSPLAEADLPVVTVQLPLFNEATVVGRLLEATARLDYPRTDLPPVDSRRRPPDSRASAGRAWSGLEAGGRSRGDHDEPDADSRTTTDRI